MSESTQDLTGRVAIVTGAGGIGGIGECTAAATCVAEGKPAGSSSREY